MERSFFLYLSQLSMFSALVPLLFSLFTFQRFNRVQKIIVFLLLAAFLTEMVSNALWEQLINNNPVFHVYAVIEFFFIAKIFQISLVKIIPPIYFNLMLVVFIGFAIANSLWFQNIFEFNSNVTVASSALILLFAAGYFFALLQEETLRRLDRDPAFWVSVGALIYYSTNLVLFFVNQNQELMLEDRYTIWGMHSVVNIVLVSFYFIGLWTQPEEE